MWGPTITGTQNLKSGGARRSRESDGEFLVGGKEIKRLKSPPTSFWHHYPKLKKGLYSFHRTVHEKLAAFG